MQNLVSIKGKENGLEIVLSEKSTYPILREELIQVLKKNSNFFKDSRTKVVLRGKSLSEAQRKEIKRVFSMDYGISDVMYGDEVDLLKEAEISIQPPQQEPQSAPSGKSSFDESDLISTSYFDAQSIFINNTVRSGQRIECEGDIIVIGDVNPGAEGIAGGSIAVFGNLRGLVHAGAAGRKDVCVAAINMTPKQLRLSGRVVTFPKEAMDTGRAEVAELRGGKVVIRPVGPVR